MANPTISSLEIVARDMVRVNFSCNMKNNAALSLPANYVWTAIDGTAIETKEVVVPRSDYDPTPEEVILVLMGAPEVDKRYRLLISGVTNTLGEGVQTTLYHSGSISAAGYWNYYGPLYVPAGGSIAVRMSGDGNPDLYLREGDYPTLVAYDEVDTALPASVLHTGEGEYYIGVYSNGTTSTFYLTITFDGSYTEMIGYRTKVDDAITHLGRSMYDTGPKTLLRSTLVMLLHELTTLSAANIRQYVGPEVSE